MSGTEDQIRELARMGATLQHVRETVDTMAARVELLATKAELGDYMTRTEHGYQLKALESRLEQVEKNAEKNSPHSVIRRWSEIMGAIAVTAAVVAMIVNAGKP